MKSAFRTVSCVAFALLGMALLGCADSSEEERVLAVIDAAEKAAEDRDVSDTMDLVADDYRDDQGLDKPQLENYVRVYYLSHPHIELLVTTGDVKFTGKGIAQVGVNFTLVGSKSSGTGTSLTADGESLQVELRQRDSEWKVVRVDRVRR